MVTADIVLKTIRNLQNGNFMRDIRHYDKFKNQLVEYRDLAVHVYNEYKLVSVRNEYIDEMEQFKNSNYVITRTLYVKGNFYTCTVKYVLLFWKVSTTVNSVSC